MTNSLYINLILCAIYKGSMWTRSLTKRLLEEVPLIFYSSFECHYVMMRNGLFEKEVSYLSSTFSTPESFDFGFSQGRDAQRDWRGGWESVGLLLCLQPQMI